MKKLFLLLTLSFFSAQSFAGSCPDGSEPVKSISDDGTYFVYNCAAQSSSLLSSSSSANPGSWNDPGPLDELTIPDNWQIFNNKQDFEDARSRSRERAPTRPGFDEKECSNILKDWRNSMEFMASVEGKKEVSEDTAFGNNDETKINYQTCLDYLIYTTQNYIGTPDYMQEILLHWAKTDAVFIPSGAQGESGHTYIYRALESWTEFGGYYAIFYDEFKYSDAEREIVDAYLKDKILNLNTINLYAAAGGGKVCDPDNIEKTIEGLFARNNIELVMNENTCSGRVIRDALAQLLVGLRLNDKAIFKKGIENTKWILNFFDDNGQFVPLSVKGASAYQYTANVSNFLGSFTEIYASVGYDFMEYKLRNGLSVKQLMDRQYELFLNPHLLDDWVRRYPSDYKGVHNEYFLKSSREKIIEIDMNLFAFVRALPRYVDTYRADIGKSYEFDKKLVNQSKAVRGVVAQRSIGGILDPYLTYISDITEPEPEINSDHWNYPGPLDELTIPDNWQLVENKQAFIDARSRLRGLVPTMDWFDINEKKCLSALKDWRQSMQLEEAEKDTVEAKNSVIIGDCVKNFIYTTQNYIGTPDYMQEILLHWAKTDAVFIPSGALDGTWAYYHKGAVDSLTNFGNYYATFYDEFNYSDTDKEIVDAYLKDKLLNLNTRNQTESSLRPCDPHNLEKTVEGQLIFNGEEMVFEVYHESCGASVWQAAVAQLLLGLRLNNKALFKKGIENTKWQLNFFDDSGIFTTWAITGALSYRYSNFVPIILGGLTEIYASVGYDFMEHKLRNGLSVKQLMDRQYELFLNPHLLDDWVRRYPSDYQGVPNSQYLQSTAEQIRNDTNMNLFAFVRALPRYIDTYRADIGKSVEFDKNLSEQSFEVIHKVGFASATSYQPLDPYLVYISDITEPEPEINWDAEDKLKGEYAAKWYIGNAMDNPVTFEFRGKDTLTLKKGKGVFSGVFSGMGYRFPSRDERGKLKIEYKPNGEITVEGDLGIFHDNKSYPTFLEGDINSGLISGVWAEGDLIKIEITKVNN
jgi:hypothetical protein